MNIEKIRIYCLSLDHVSESLPFGDGVLVFKVLDKIFCMLLLDGASAINLKCKPENADDLRNRYPSVLPGCHMNKKHWNTVLLDGSIPDSVLKDWISLSYNLVIEKMPAKKRHLFQK